MDIKALLLMIKLMTFSLQNLYSVSIQSYGGTSEEHFQGFFNGNGGLLGLWLLVCHLLVKYLRYEVHMVKRFTPISYIGKSLAALIFMDNTDIMAEGSTEE